jgi:hypothetical protein
MAFHGRTEKLRNDLRCGVSDRVLDGALQINEDSTALLDTSDSGGKVVIKENHSSCLFRYIRARYVHCNAKVRALQRWIVIDTITSSTTLC